jgi:DNA-binding response OmpR family regulator
MSQDESSLQKTILLVEDESAVRTVLRTVLVADGYKVIDVDRAAEAIKIEDPLDLLIVNFYLPDMKGYQLVVYW